jgi:hypothetical protein
MGKEKSKPKWDIDKEYPKWAWVDFKCQNAKCFEVRQLSSKWLDPKHELMDEHLTTKNIISFLVMSKHSKSLIHSLEENCVFSTSLCD